MSALAMRSTILSVLGAVYARARDFGGILGGLMLASDKLEPCRGNLGGVILASDMPESCRPCLRGRWNDMDEKLRSLVRVVPLLASHRELLAVWARGGGVISHSICGRMGDSRFCGS
jgi:hypothetical protein